MAFDRVDRDDQSIGDLLIGHAPAEATQHVLLPHRQFLERDLFAAASQPAVVQNTTDHRIEVLPVGVDGGECGGHRACSGGLGRADAVTARIDRIQNRARDRALKQHQHLQLRVLLPGLPHQAGTAAALQGVSAQKQVGRAASHSLQAVGFAGAGRHQRALAFEPECPAAEQHMVACRNGRATALEQAVALAGALLKSWDPFAEIQGRERLGAIAADQDMLIGNRGRGSALLRAAQIVQNHAS